ncbi:MAG: transposase [Anaerolineaceae bacterium]|nr:transposase [Anaerolineaceae bacterium]
MARTARKLSELGYYHLIVRGIGKQILFEEHSDYLHYLSLLKRFCKETGVTICAFCLMENHVHLLAYDPEQKIPLLMKKMGVSYSAYFNKKYERTGHLFQDRYLSEPIESEAYLLTVFRYILNNPQKAGICAADAYEWSSYKLYGSNSSFVDTSAFVELIGDKAAYAAYIAAKNEDICMDVHQPKIGDKNAKTLLGDLLDVESGTELQSVDRDKRDKAIKLLLENGMTIRQIERLTGISRGIIQRL